MANNFDHSDLTLHGRFVESNDGNEQYRLYVLLNGVELPVQYLDVKDYREKFDEARQNAKAQQASAQEQQEQQQSSQTTAQPSQQTEQPQQQQ